MIMRFLSMSETLSESTSAARQEPRAAAASSRATSSELSMRLIGLRPEGGAQ
jgi:hypothetical protein